MEQTVKCFFVVPNGFIRRSLRRYTSSELNPDKCPISKYYHNAQTVLDEIADVPHDRPYEWSKDDPRWPVACECGYQFKDNDQWQVFCDTLYRRTDTGGIISLKTPGAMYHATWLTGDYWVGPDGNALMVILPDGHAWHVDGRANNCDSPCKNCGQPYSVHHAGNAPCMKYDDVRPHKCWIRHGTVPHITVDKNGVTCGAGAGSIMTDKWHGFLRDGVLAP